MKTNLITQEWDGYRMAFKTDGFASLTALCQPFGKRPYEFLRLPQTERFLESLAAAENLPKEELVRSSKGRPAQQEQDSDDKCGKIPHLNSGTWVHPDIALECARWLSPAFAIWCNRVIRGILNGSIEVEAEELPAPVMVDVPAEKSGSVLYSIAEYLNAEGLDWSLKVEGSFGRIVQKHARDLAFVKKIEDRPDFGEAQVYPRWLFERVRKVVEKRQQEEDTSSSEFAQLTHALFEHHGSLEVEGSEVREMAQRLGLFAAMFRGTTMARQCSAFGKLAEKYNGKVLSNGLRVIIRPGRIRKLQVLQAVSLAA